MKLFDQAQLGDLKLKNSMVMSAMTRSRADINGVVGDMHVVSAVRRKLNIEMTLPLNMEYELMIREIIKNSDDD
jgi:hypothetical protein